MLLCWCVQYIDTRRGDASGESVPNVWQLYGSSWVMVHRDGATGIFPTVYVGIVREMGIFQFAVYSIYV